MKSLVIIVGVSGQGLDDRNSTSGRGVSYLIIIAPKAALHIEYLRHVDRTFNNSYIM
jgi:hypothetical protein